MDIYGIRDVLITKRDIGSNHGNQCAIWIRSSVIFFLEKKLFIHIPIIMHTKAMSRSVSFELHTKKERKLKSTYSSRTTFIQSICYKSTLWRLLSWISYRHKKTVIW